MEHTELLTEIPEAHPHRRTWQGKGWASSLLRIYPTGNRGGRMWTSEIAARRLVLC